MGRRADRGQSTVEFALVLPAIAAVVLVVAQIGLLIQAQIAATHAAREIARVLAVAPDSDPYATLERVSDLRSDRVQLQVSLRFADIEEREIVEVRVTYAVPVVATVLAFLDGNVEVSARAAMLVER